MEKEVYIQAEMYRLLKNAAVIPDQRPYLIDVMAQRLAGHYIDPFDVWIEASVGLQEVDLLLRVGDTGTVKSALVIEIKKRTLSSPTIPFRAALNQARRYAEVIGCPLYAAYDGNTIVLMQDVYPFLVGIQRMDISANESTKIGFARRIWQTSINLLFERAKEPVLKLAEAGEYYRWLKSIRTFIRDAHDAFIERSHLQVGKEERDKAVEEIAALWDSLSTT
jgi:hypothetical protein